MSIYDTVECPSCGYEHDMDQYEFDGDDELDVECEQCGVEFEVVREWFPSYSSHAINYITCDDCNKTIRESAKRTFDRKKLCLTCHTNRFIEVTDKR